MMSDLRRVAADVLNTLRILRLSQKKTCVFGQNLTSNISLTVKYESAHAAMGRVTWPSFLFCC